MITALCACAAMMYACGGDASKTTDAQTAIKPVKYSKVTRTGGRQSKTFNGASKSSQETKLSFRTSGLIVKLNVKVGDRVTRGQLLARLDQKEIELNIEKSRASLQSAKIQLETAKSNLERIKELYQANSASLNDYEQSKNSFANANSSYQTAKKSLDLQNSQLTYARITAPTGGVISALNAEVNEFAQAGTPIMTINSGEGEIEINVGVPEAYISDIHQDDEVSVVFSGIKDKTYSGAVTEVGYAAGGSGTYPVIVKLSNPGSEIRPGMPAETTFQFGSDTTEMHLTVPVKSVGDDYQGTYVFKLEKNDDNVYVVRKTKVELGHLNDNGFVALSGVADGDLIATAGLRSLFDGRKVTLLD